MTNLPTDERAQPGTDATRRRGRRTGWLVVAVAVVVLAGVALVVVSHRGGDGSSDRRVR